MMLVHYATKKQLKLIMLYLVATLGLFYSLASILALVIEPQEWVFWLTTIQGIVIFLASMSLVSLSKG